MGSSSAPKQDPAIGEAALLSAQTGQDMLDFMQGQAAITTGWAQEDRARYETTFRPIEDQFVKDSLGWDTAARRTSAVTDATAGVRSQAAMGREINGRAMAARGVKPGSGAYGSGSAGLQEGLAAVGAGNAARDAVIAEGRAREAQAITLGSGLPGAASANFGMSTSAMGAGFQGAMSGYGQQGQLLNQQYQNDLAAWDANQQSMGSLMGGLGSLAGTALALSDEDAKENKKPARGALKAVEGMRVDTWDYKEGQGDGGSHIGTYAQDFARETGKGDGHTINLIDAVGVTMGAVKELAAEVRSMKRAPRGAPKAPGHAGVPPGRSAPPAPEPARAVAR